MKAVVIGGGVVGLFTAYYLRREDVDVVVIEQGDLGQWSRAAAGILEFTRFVINRINVKSYLYKYIYMVFKGEARVKTLDRAWISTYLKVLGKAPTPEMWDGIKFFGDFSRRQYKAFAEEKNDFDYSEEPLYEIGVDVEKALEEARRDPLTPKVERGFCCGQDALVYLDAAKLSTEDFVERLKRELSDVVFIKRRAEEIVGTDVWLEGGAVERGDVVIVAAGYWARKLGVPVAPLKGYGFRTFAKARHMFLDMRYGFAVVPLSKWTKITGRFDLDGSDDHTPSNRVINNAKRLLGDFDIIDMAVGYRPCTPDGFPVIDRLDSVVIVTGACRLGWTYGPALGKAAADLALGRRTTEVFTTRRFRDRP
ncbi:MAG: FAD-binding oxidoreductase [Pyrobaculum sp.]